MFKIELGSSVKSRVMGLKGIVIARTEWLYHCVRYVVQPQELKDGRPVENCSFDEDELIVLAPPTPEITGQEEIAAPNPKAITGGDRDHVHSLPTVSR
jgi:hypothetical protein